MSADRDTLDLSHGPGGLPGVLDIDAIDARARASLTCGGTGCMACDVGRLVAEVRRLHAKCQCRGEYMCPRCEDAGAYRAMVEAYRAVKAELEAKDAAIRGAPHADGCRQIPSGIYARACNCWKSRAGVTG